MFSFGSRCRVARYRSIRHCCALATGDKRPSRGARRAEPASSEDWSPVIIRRRDTPASAELSRLSVGPRPITSDATRVARCARESAERDSASSSSRLTDEVASDRWLAENCGGAEPVDIGRSVIHASSSRRSQDESRPADGNCLRRDCRPGCHLHDDRRRADFEGPLR